MNKSDLNKNYGGGPKFQAGFKPEQTQGGFLTTFYRKKKVEKAIIKNTTQEAFFITNKTKEYKKLQRMIMRPKRVPKGRRGSTFGMRALSQSKNISYRDVEKWRKKQKRQRLRNKKEEILNLGREKYKDYVFIPQFQKSPIIFDIKV